MLRFLLGGVVAFGLGAGALPPWLVLPPTPALPRAAVAGHVTVNGARLWYAELGRGHAQTVVLLHGGLANSNYWGLLAPDLARDYHVVLIDTRPWALRAQ
jgi:alpha-beta hydrolase superfamily lysophospholipase